MPTELHTDRYRLQTHHNIAACADDNLDIIISDLKTGDTYHLTFITPASITAIMARHAQSGECSHGLYFWTSNMIVVNHITLDVIRRVIDDLFNSGEMKQIGRYPSSPQRGDGL